MSNFYDSDGYPVDDMQPTREEAEQWLAEDRERFGWS